MLYSSTITSFPVRNLPYNFSTGTNLINTDFIFGMELSGDDDALITYKLRPRFSRESTFQFIVSNTLAQVVTGSNVSANSNLVALPVFKEDNVSSTAVTTYFNIGDIAWADEGSDGTYSYVYVNEGADIKRYIVDYSLAQIMDVATTGTTTTTTTTTGA